MAPMLYVRVCAYFVMSETLMSYSFWEVVVVVMMAMHQPIEQIWPMCMARYSIGDVDDCGDGCALANKQPLLT